MNRAVCVTTWREFKSNKVRLVMLFLLMVAPVSQYTVQRCQSPECLTQDLLTPAGIALAYTLLWGAGVIGRETQHGTISLVLARPISIVSYVMSKWFAVGLAAAVCSFQAVLIEHLISSAFCPSLLWQGDFLINGMERTFLCFGGAAFLILLSSLVSGLKDLALLAGILFLLTLSSWTVTLMQYVPGGTTGKLAEQLGHIFAILGQGIIAILYPMVPVGELICGNYNSILTLLSYSTLVTCCLSLAIFVLTRKEFSYAAE
jgi:ABC-type transport system involved in multi-copper enzyme maturation permease subunit